MKAHSDRILLCAASGTASNQEESIVGHVSALDQISPRLARDRYEIEANTGVELAGADGSNGLVPDVQGSEIV